MIGKTLGNWRVVSEPYNVNSRKHVDVECLCGKSGVVSRSLSSLKSRGGSCGCLRGAKVSEARRASAPPIEVGDRFGKLTVTSIFYEGNRRYLSYTCDCGNTKAKTLSDNITKGQKGADV